MPSKRKFAKKASQVDFPHNQANLASLGMQVENEKKAQGIQQRELQKLIKLRDRLLKTTSAKDATDIESQMYAEIFELDEKIKNKEKDIQVLERALR